MVRISIKNVIFALCFLTDSMKHLIVTIITLSALFSACTGKQDPTEQISLMEASRQELATALEERDQLLCLVKEISVSMDQIRHLENIMTVSGTHAKENPSQRTRILSDISSLKRTLKQRREQLAQLETRLEESSLYTDELKSTVKVLYNQIDTQTREIENLRGQLTMANARIDSLNNAVDSLNTTVATINDNLDMANAASIRLEDELNTCYYIVTSKSELKKHQILETGFLRKSKLLKGDFDKGFFVIGDKRNMHTIELNSDKARVHTNHPEDSYAIRKENNKKILVILDPEKFWSLTNYLVIQTD